MSPRMNGQTQAESEARRSCLQRPKCEDPFVESHG